jgi:hypothetical protein
MSLPGSGSPPAQASCGIRGEALHYLRCGADNLAEICEPVLPD